MRDGQEFGPYTWEQVVEHARGGRIGRGDKLLDPSTGAWVKSAKVAGLFGTGGAAVIPVGMSMAAKIAVGTIITLAALLASFFVFWSMSPGDTLAVNPGSVIVQQGDTASSTSPTVVMAPEGLTFKGTFRWEDRDGPVNHWSEGPCYLWIYTTEWGTMGAFDFQEDVGYLRWNGRDLPLETHTGTHYVFLSSDLTMVDHWKMVVDVTNTGVSGTITNITPEIGSFVGGTFSGTTIPYEQYKAEAPN